MNLLTEFEVRSRLGAILRSDAPPMRKVRLILDLGRALRAQARSIVHARDASAEAQDRDTAARLDRLSSSHRMLYDEVRLAARKALEPERTLVGEPALTA
ncbi:MAG: hypothetical protein WAO58_01620 [Fimbriimonadaceae bacterium]